MSAGVRGKELDEDDIADGESLAAYESNQRSQSLKLESDSKSLGRGAYERRPVPNGWEIEERGLPMKEDRWREASVPIANETLNA